MGNIWRELPKPSFILAPMDNVTDTVFRRIVATTGAPDLCCTEFTYVDGLLSRGRAATARRLRHTAAEPPLLAQLWGTNPEHFHAVARELASGAFGPFAGIDLNMGCPEHRLVRRGACAGLIDDPERAVAIIRATKAGAGDLPVSVKTRCGTTGWVTEAWAGTLLREDLAALTIHGRIASEQSTCPARWEEIARVVALRDRLSVGTAIIGNGDVTSHADGLAKVARYGVDGVMVGRGIFRNLWLFDPRVDPAAIPLAARIDLLTEYLHLWQATWAAGERHFAAPQRLYKAFFAGVPHTTDLLRALAGLRTADEALACLAAERMRLSDAAPPPTPGRADAGTQHALQLAPML